MKILTCIIFMIMSLICIATEPKIEIRNIDTLSKYMKDYNKLWQITRKGFSKMPGSQYDTYRNIENALCRQFNTYPEDFKKLYAKSPDIFKFTAFCFFVKPETKAADKVYCDILRKIIKKQKVTPKLIWNWALDFAGSTYSLDFLNDYQKAIMDDEKLTKIDKKIYLEKLQRNKMVVDLYKELSNTNLKTTNKWEAYFLPSFEITINIEQDAKKREQELRKEYYPEGIDLSKISNDDEKASKKYEELTKKIKALQDAIPYLYLERTIETTKRTIKELKELACIDSRKIKVDYLSLFRVLCKSGGKLSDSYKSSINSPNVLVYNEKKQLIYVFTILTPHDPSYDYKSSFELFKFYYDKNGNPIDYVLVDFDSHSKEMNKIFRSMLPVGKQRDPNSDKH